MERKINKRLNLKEALYNCYTNQSFKGRSRRSEFWWNTLIYSIFLFVLDIVEPLLAERNDTFGVISAWCLVLIFLIMGYYQFALTFRRLHDIGRSGWWAGLIFIMTLLCNSLQIYVNEELAAAFSFINYVYSSVVLLGFCSMDSMIDENKYGKSPKYDLTYNYEDIEKHGMLSTVFICILGAGGCLFKLTIPILIGCLISSRICDISSTETYSWYSGIWHGIFFFPNLLRSFFSDALYKAESYTTAYNVWWWIVVVFQCLGLFGGRESD